MCEAYTATVALISLMNDNRFVNSKAAASAILEEQH